MIIPVRELACYEKDGWCPDGMAFDRDGQLCIRVEKNDVFDGCTWLTFREKLPAALTRSTFTADGAVKAELKILALGYFEAYLNGEAVSQDKFVPAVSDYTERDLSGIHMPCPDTLSHRIYYLTYDVTPRLREGKNVLACHIGAGWFGQNRSRNEGMPYWGDNLLVFRLTLTFADGTQRAIVSSPENTKWTESFIRETNIYFGEVHDMEHWEKGWNETEFDDRAWQTPTPMLPPHTNLCDTDFPSDRVTRVLTPKVLYRHGDLTLYDIGETAAGYAVLRFTEDARWNDTAVVRYADALRDDLSMEFHYCGGTARMQRDLFIHADTAQGYEYFPHFTWHAGRYFEVIGKAEAIRFEVVHTDLGEPGTFESDNETLNWIFNAYVRTQQANVHGCVPSDCPHRERLGYTGDGELTCNAVLHTFGAEKMYKKWMRDIRDCQDRYNGHVQHTAPFYGGGGGPGGWGGAAVIVPYQYYLHFNDTEILRSSFGSMEGYIRYMLDHTEDGIVTHAEKGGWCLGDWCPPHNDVRIPESFVNTCFLVKTAVMTADTAHILGKEDKKEYYLRVADEARGAILRHFHDPRTGSFCDGVQGADAFALDIGLGDERTESALLSHYRENPTFDTGIFGTDLVIRTLFRLGEGELAFRLLTNEEEASFYTMKKNGATTLWENWDGCDSRCHPMFGAVIAYFFSCILGIRRENGKPGFEEVVIEPACIPQLKRASGTMHTPKGDITVQICTDETGKRTVRYEAAAGIRVRLSDPCLSE